MRCPSCNKFPALSTDTDPETDSLEPSDVEFDHDQEKTKLEGTVNVTGDVRIVLTSECCGDEIKEANFSPDVHIDVKKHKDCTCEDWTDGVELEVENAAITDRNEAFQTKTAKRGLNKGTLVQVPIPFRYQKRFYGVEMELHIKCACGKEIGMDTFSDEEQASAMEELN